MEQLRKIIVQQMGVKLEEIKPESNFNDDLDFDSLDFVELVLAMENEFEIEIPDETWEGWKTVGDIEAYLAGLQE